MQKRTRQQKLDFSAMTAKKDADIDFSDIPPIVDWSKAEVGKFHRRRKVTRSIYGPVGINVRSDSVDMLSGVRAGR